MSWNRSKNKWNVTVEAKFLIHFSLIYNFCTKDKNTTKRSRKNSLFFYSYFAASFLIYEIFKKLYDRVTSLGGLKNKSFIFSEIKKGRFLNSILMHKFRLWLQHKENEILFLKKNLFYKL